MNGYGTGYISRLVGAATAAFLVFISANAFSAQVESISSSHQGILISNDASGPWTKGAGVCVVRDGKAIVCGKVAKASSKNAIVKLDSLADGIQVGDLVSGNVFSAQVQGISSNHQIILISNGTSGPWTKGAGVCVVRDGKAIACGRVAKTTSKNAMARLDSVADGIQVGDLVRQTGRGKASSESAIAVPSKGKRSQLGFELGTNLANASISPAVSPSPAIRLGGMFGPFIHLQISEMLAWNVALLYTEKGPTASAGGNSATFRFDYIELSPRTLYFLTRSDPRIFLSAGLFLGYLINSKVDTVEGGVAQVQNVSSIPAIDAGFELGLGIGFQVTESINLIGSIQFAYGLTNLATTSGDTWNSTGIQFLGGAAFAL